MHLRKITEQRPFQDVLSAEVLPGGEDFVTISFPITLQIYAHQHPCGRLTNTSALSKATLILSNYCFLISCVLLICTILGVCPPYLISLS
jgi:hypothetical protein